MKNLLKYIKIHHRALRAAIQSVFGLRERWQIILALLCIYVIDLVILLSTLPLLLFLLRVAVVVLAVVVSMECVLRVIYSKKDTCNAATIPLETEPPRLDTACADPQGCLRKIEIPNNQVEEMASTILSRAYTRSPSVLQIGKYRLYALARLIRDLK